VVDHTNDTGSDTRLPNGGAPPEPKVLGQTPRVEEVPPLDEAPVPPLTAPGDTDGG
jgi:hypothetical protein